MSDDRQDPLTRQGALLLSYLMMTPDSGLASFAQRKMACAGISVEQLATLRNVLDALSFVVASDSREDWHRVNRAWEALKGVQRPPQPAAAPPAPTPQPERQEAPASPPQRPAAPAARPVAAPPPAPATRPAAPPSTAAHPLHEHPAIELPPEPADEDIGGTAFLSDAELAAVLAAGSTPFRAGGAAPPPSMRSLGGHEDIGATATVSVADIEGALAGMPAPRDAQLPMSINDYAQLVSRTEAGGPDANGAGRQQCHEQLHVSDEAHRTAVDAAFSAWLRTNEQGRRDYEYALARWRDWLHRPRT